ncbi:MAG: type II toxin-antitoxin system mRNA interferase toxin, RelE/StbE family [Candidatus Pacebacteria bacterium]|nr:type II toxin-antitoxin system mRNA interferase toxin, RelE/StbE family [Candidatus Paceibacterota bacterium]
MRVTTTKKFDKKVKNLPKKIQKELARRLTIFMNDVHDPFLRTHKLSGKLKDLWSFSVSGDIRVVFDMSYREVAILIDIGSHSDLYK